MDHKTDTDSERAAFIRWHTDHMYSGDRRAAQVWDSGHVIAQAWQARASLAASAGSEPVAQPSDADAILAKVCDLFQIGKLARTESTILVNVGNVIRFAALLHAVERDLFPQPELPENDDPYSDVGDLLPAPNSWAAKDDADYVAQFREALAARGFTHPSPPEPALQPSAGDKPTGYWDGNFSPDGGATLYEVPQVSPFGRTYRNVPLYTRPQPQEREAEQALRKVLAAVQRYLPPDGPSAHDAMTEIIGIVDPWPLGPLEKS